MQRIAGVFCVMLLVIAVGASAQTTTRIEGTVASIDPVGKTITFTDGRVMQFNSDARIYINGREVAVGEIRPGAVVVMTSAVPVVPSAQSTTRITGTVAAFDPVAKTVTFTDGRTVQFDPSSRLFVNGREVSAAEVRPGAVIVMSPPVAVAPGPPQPAAAPATISSRAHPLADASGTVASVDRQNGIITLTDGRMLRLTNEGRVWQAVSSGTLQPGTEVYVSNAIPVGFRSAGAAETWTDRDVMGRVTRVDPTGNEILLGDGTLVRVSPSTRMVMASGQTVMVKDLRPGDQVIVRVQQPPGTAQVVVPGASSPRVASDQPTYSSWSAYRGAVVEAVSIVVIRYPQAP